MIDTLIRNLEKISSGEFIPAPILKEFCDNKHRYAVLTLHRRSNKGRIPPLWDGKSSERIAEIILKSIFNSAN